MVLDDPIKKVGLARPHCDYIAAHDQELEPYWELQNDPKIVALNEGAVHYE